MTLKLYEIQVLVSTSRVLLKHSHAHSFILICLHIICGCFCTTKAELSICSRDYVANEAENIYYLILYIKSLLTPALGVTHYFLTQIVAC